MLFCNTVAVFHRCSLKKKQLLWNPSTWSIKMSVADNVFSSVGGRALSWLLKLVTTKQIFFNFFSLDFSTSACKSSFLMLLSLKFQKNNMKLPKIQKFGKISVHQLLITVIYYTTAAIGFIGNFYFFLATTVFQILCVCLFR